jgi:hypothetical protein
VPEGSERPTAGQPEGLVDPSALARSTRGWRRLWALGVCANAPELLGEGIDGGAELLVSVGHLAPTLLVDQQASDRAFRRLARELAGGGASMTLLERLCRADHFGRTTPEAVARAYPEGDLFLQRVAALAVADAGPKDVVLGRHVLARGLAPGPEVGDLLRRCRDLQDETGLTDPDAILDLALSTRR